jgi:hypothetical protein
VTEVVHIFQESVRSKCGIFGTIKNVEQIGFFDRSCEPSLFRIRRLNARFRSNASALLPYAFPWPYMSCSIRFVLQRLRHRHLPLRHSH